MLIATLNLTEYALTSQLDKVPSFYVKHILTKSLQAEVRVLALLQPNAFVSVDRQAQILQWGLTPGPAAGAYRVPLQRWSLPSQLTLLCPR